jgi:hypothetical protein
MADADRGAAYLEKEIAGKPRLVSPSSLTPKIMELWRNGSGAWRQDGLALAGPALLGSAREC